MSGNPPERPTTDDPAAWRAYWQAQGMPWRTEPEICAERQTYLGERRAVPPDIDRGIYPFKDITLTRADVEWLLATHESGGIRGPVDWTAPKQRNREGLDLCGVDLRGVDLQHLPLARVRCNLSNAELPDHGSDDDSQLVTMAVAHLEGANLSYAHMENMLLRAAHLDGATLRRAVLDGTTLYSAWLVGANFARASLAGVNLRRAVMDETTNFYGASFCSREYGGVALRDAHWNGADCTVVDWDQLKQLGDERRLVGRRSVNDFQKVVRAYRQLAVVLRAQGLNEHSDRFAYRAQVMQRRLLLRQGHLLRWLGSWLLDALAGYGYRPMRSVASYVVVIGLFAAVYFLLGGAHAQPVSWNEAIVISMTAFHGRGFFATAFQPADPQAALAAVEALVGLLIEITFIATFTQRFFAR
jgi:uncharacterized protein YjbI with pentapeptide repeats